MKHYHFEILLTLLCIPFVCGYAQWNWVARSTPNVEYYASSVVGNRAYFWGALNIVIYTDDQGETFSVCNSYDDIDDSSLGDFKEQGIAFADSLTGYIGDVAHGEFRTSNGGKTWEKKADRGSNIWLIGFADSTFGWKLGSGGLYKTTNTGMTWTLNNLGENLFANGYFSDLYVTNKDKAWFTKRSSYNGQGGWVYYTTDGGIIWHQATTHLKSDSLHQVSYNRVKVNSSGIGIVAGDIYYPGLVGSIRSLILRTTNNGITWDSLTVGSHRLREIISIGDSIWIIYGYIMNDGLLDRDRVVQYRSIDYGKSWTVCQNISNNQNLNNFYTCAFLPKDSTIIVSTTQGFFCSKDLGLTYKKLTKTDFFVTNFTFDKQPLSSNSQLGIALISGKKYLITTNGGSYWRIDSIVQSSTSQLLEVKISRGIIYINGDNYRLFRSVDQGKTWSITLPQTFNFRNLSLLNAGTLSAISSSNIVVSRDSGSTWKSMTMPSKFAPSFQTLTEENCIFSSGQFSDSTNYYRGFIYQTTDFGFNWRINDFPSRISEVQKISSTNLLAVSSSSIYQSKDNGKHWKSVALPSDYYPISNIAMFDSLRGTAWRIYYFLETSNGGESWTKKASSIPIQGSTKRIEYNFKGDLYVLGTNGTFVYQANAISQSNKYLGMTKLNISNFVIENFPNPFNPITTISYIVPFQTHLKISIFNILGQEVTTLIDEVKDAGQYSVQWNGSQCASGMYFLTMTSEKFTATKKMVLMR